MSSGLCSTSSSSVLPGTSILSILDRSEWLPVSIVLRSEAGCVELDCECKVEVKMEVLSFLKGWARAFVPFCTFFFKEVALEDSTEEAVLVDLAIVENRETAATHPADYPSFIVSGLGGSLPITKLRLLAWNEVTVLETLVPKKKKPKITIGW